MLYDTIEIDYTVENEARDGIKRLIVDGSAEMNSFQQAFVAGIIKKYNPLL